ncbi:hypothetical protein KSF78_0002592 [Schistosoma japonicum]|nr:hypothetical protein KSF78_0002592 [Schistosoma japonicum]
MYNKWTTIFIYLHRIMFTVTSLITILLTIVTEVEVRQVNITRLYVHDCAIFTANDEQLTHYDYEYKLEVLEYPHLINVSKSNEVTLCNIPMCKLHSFRFTTIMKHKSDSKLNQDFSQEFKKSLDAPKISDIVADFRSSDYVKLKWTLQDSTNCKDKILVFFLYGDKTIMQHASGLETKILGLHSSEEYTVYAYPSLVDDETRVYMSAPFKFTVP